MSGNYMLAAILSLLILLGYPYFLKWISPQAPPGSEILQEKDSLTGTEPLPAAEEKTAALHPPEGPFLENAAPPSLVPFENELYEGEFSTLGGSLTRLFFKGEAGKNGIDKTLFYQGEPAAPGLFGIRLSRDEPDLTRSIFKLHRQDPAKGIFEFVFERPGEYRLTKTFVLEKERPVIHLEITLDNLSGREKHFPAEIDFGIDYALTRGLTAHNFEALISSEGVRSATLDRISKKGYQVSESIAWAGLVKKYFSLLTKPDWKAIGFDASSDGKILHASLVMEPVTVAQGAKEARQFFIYAGPQHYETLKSLGTGFEAILSRGMFGLFKIWLLIALKFLYQYTHNFGWAIILLTLLLKGAFTPLTHMSFENMKRMQALQPKLKSLQERHKKDPAKLQKEMAGLYKRNRVNPMAGCLPMVIQIPVFVAFYQALSNAIELQGAPFIGWIRDLSEPDRLFPFPFTAPLVGWDALNVLPFLMIGSMVWQQKLTPSSSGMPPEQAQMMQLTPVIFGFMFYNMPSGLVLYWFVNNMLSVIHQVFVKRMVVDLHH